MPLPDDGPTSTDQVKGYVGITDAAEDARLALIVPAVNAVVRGLPIVANLPDADPEVEIGFPDQVPLGATMLAARLLRRWNSPDGIAAFGEQGPVYIQRNDPDIGLLLGLGAAAKPAVG